MRKSAAPHLGLSGSSGRDGSTHTGWDCPSLICGLAHFRWLLGTPPKGRPPPANMSLFLQWLCSQTLHTGGMFRTPPSVFAHPRNPPCGCLQSTLLGQCLPLGLLWAADLSRFGFATCSVLLGTPRSHQLYRKALNWGWLTVLRYSPSSRREAW